MDTPPDPTSIPDLNFSFPPGLKESFISTFVESMVYGAYIPVFLECMIVLRRKKLGNANHWYLVATTVSMFALVSARCFYEVNGSIETFNDLTHLLNSVQSDAFFISLDYALLVAIADAFLVFRTFVVWNRRWIIIIFPVMLYLGSCGASIYSLVALKSVGPTGDVQAKAVTDAGDVFLILTFCTNVLCTGLISFRILNSYGPRRSDGLKIISVLIESAALNTMLLIGLLVTTRLNSMSSYVLSGCSSPTIALSFSLIVVRVGRGTSYGDTLNGSGSTSGDVGAFTTQGPEFELGESRDRRGPSLSRSRNSEVRVRLEGRERDIPEEGEVDLEASKAGEGSVV
ncbi:hypothetical protein FB45DRAFT_236495 [Roridomyces roridus]|uniref:Uncharacterized protein n=1 Tax=Roridomyces roridus TaxID=1738132 RepID=A0AAD7BBW8_9AGAR|nr:hypothetical protein FB45DRAFT_236495 [Roridomyces roridus]